MIRPSDGFPAMYKTWPTYEEAKDWAIQEEAKRRQGIYFPEKLKKKHTVAELIDLYTEALPHLGVKSAEDILCHLKCWKAKIGKYTLNHINSDRLKNNVKSSWMKLPLKGLDVAKLPSIDKMEFAQFSRHNLEFEVSSSVCRILLLVPARILNYFIMRLYVQKMWTHRLACD